MFQSLWSRDCPLLLTHFLICKCMCISQQPLSIMFFFTDSVKFANTQANVRTREQHIYMHFNLAIKCFKNYFMLGVNTVVFIKAKYVMSMFFFHQYSCNTLYVFISFYICASISYVIWCPLKFKFKVLLFWSQIVQFLSEMQILSNS